MSDWNNLFCDIKTYWNTEAAEGLAIPRSPGVKPTICFSGRSPCEKQDIKHVGVCRSSANFPAKKIKENKMADFTTLNCLIVPIGKLMNIPCIKVMQSITIGRAGSAYLSSLQIPTL
ncbi:unnamed protein product [Rhizophagus irregularis]|nr:unnamed protein product [Rhizophagus irregularis]